MREGVEKPIEVTVVRDVIRSSRCARASRATIGYIRIATFSEQTIDGLKKAIDKIKTEIGADKLKGFVLDLRNNPGGLLDQAISVSDAFLDHGEIVSTRGRHADETQRFSARAGDLDRRQAGHRAGQRRLGLGLGDRRRRAAGPSPRDDRRHALLRQGLGADDHPDRPNGALRLTTARYYTPSGRSIQAKGIDPDIEVIQELPPELAAQPAIGAARRGEPQAAT